MQLVPYLNFQGNCEEALQFYARCFNGEIVSLIRFGDSPMPDTETYSQKIMHAQLKFGQVLVMASDNVQGPACQAGSMVHLSIDFPQQTENGKDMDTIFQELAEGGTVTMPLQKTFWNAYFGMLTDRYGICWMFNHDFAA
ncbi:MAG: VOC family protein [Chitinophagales bacterium]|nr:VOC family protein [Chitinophagales bacterium]